MRSFHFRPILPLPLTYFVRSKMRGVGAYSRGALFRGWGLIQGNTVSKNTAFLLCLYIYFGNEE